MATDYCWEFNDDESLAEWRKDCVSATVEWGEPGVLKLKATRGSPYVFSPKVEIAADKQNVIILRMKRAPGILSGGLILFVTEDDPKWDDEKLVNFPCKPNGDFNEYEVDMSKNPQWKGVATRLRLQLLNIADTALTEDNSVIEIDYVRVPDLAKAAKEKMAASASRELIRNGGFEELDGGGNPVGWKHFYDDHLAVDDLDIKQYGRAKNSQVTNEAHTGQHAISIDISAGAKEIGGWSTRATMKPKTLYELSFWARREGNPFGLVKVEEFKADGARLSIYCANVNSESWKHYTLEFESKPETTGALVTANIYQSSGRLWVDDASLREMTFADDPMAEEEYQRAQTPYVQLTREVVTPHIAWATPYAGGAVKVLAIPPHREVIELAQRIEIEYATWEKLTHEEGYGNEVLDRLYYRPPKRGLLYSAADFNRKLSRSYDVILIGTCDLSSLPESLKKDLLAKVRKGAGLIVIRPKNAGWLAPALEQPVPRPNYPLAGIPVEGLPVFSEEAKDEQWFKCYCYGQGRVTMVDFKKERLGWFVCERDHWRGLYHPFTPDTTYDPSIPPVCYDYYQSWLAKLVLWAARKEGELILGRLAVQNGNLRGQLTSPVPGGTITMEIVVRDADNAIEATERRELALTQGAMDFTQTLPPLKSGPHFADVWFKNAKGQVLNWGSAWFQTKSAVNVIAVKTNRFSYAPGEIIQGAVTLDQPARSLTVNIQLRDSFGRVLAEKEATGAEQPEIPFEFELKRPVAITHTVVAILRDDQKGVLSRGKAEFVVKQPYDPTDDFRFWSWGREGHDRLSVHLLKDFYQRGFDAAYLTKTMYPLPEAEFREQLWTCAQQNLYPAPIANSELSNGSESTDRSQTVRKRAIAGQQFRNAMADDLLKKGRVGKEFPVAGYSLGDEIALSVQGQDFDFSPSGLEFIRRNLKAGYKELTALNAAWGTRFTTWEEVRPMTIAQARAHGNFAPWADLRISMEDLWTDTIRFAADHLRQNDPDARVGAEAMHSMLLQCGECSWNGYDFGKVIPQGRMWGCYFHYPNFYPQIELLRSFAVPGTALFTFANPFEDWPGGFFSDYRIAEQTDRFVPWYDLFNGFNTVNYWDSRDVDWFGFYSKDFRPTPWAKNITKVIQEIKGGIGKLVLKCKRENNGIAIHYSPPSLHAETILDGQERRQGLRAFCLLLEDLGLQYDFISAEQMAAGKLAQYQFLILPYSRAITQGEAKAMKEFAASGGILFADGPAGIMDGHCVKVKANMLNGVKLANAIHPLWNYGKVRDGADGAKTRREMREALAKAGIEPRYRIVPKDRDELPGCELVEFKDGAATYLGLLQGREYIQPENPAVPVRIVLPSKSHVYSVREGKYLGELKEIETAIEPAVAKLYALLPCRTRSLRIDGMQKAYEPGSMVAYELDANAPPNAPLPHVFCVVISQPDGRLYREYSRNLYAPDGKGRGEFQIALNDMTGRWKMLVTDVATGIKAERKFTVKGSPAD
ncbi:MAG: hypothetical protein HY360_21640 [Verrucomicrobia bacterium]|nr:hypothetical protein [Verrucomicrobiota bacterium]